VSSAKFCGQAKPDNLVELVEVVQVDAAIRQVQDIGVDGVHQGTFLVTELFTSTPKGEPDITMQVWVYRV
jgi:hypothetical protein